MSTTTTTPTATWSTVTELLGRRGATRRWHHGNNRGWYVPHTGGHLTVEITLRPRWCSMAVDRWHTTDRDPDISGPWFECHVWPHVQAACRARRGCGFLPSGATYASAHPVDRAVLLDLLDRWLEAELSWPGMKASTR